MSDLALYYGNNDDKQYIIFNINEESFGIDIMQVNSIIMMPEITKMPKTPDYIEGIISLRGRIIPIISLHKRMNYGDDVITKDSRVIILNVNEDELLGIIVDSVSEVLALPDNSITDSNTVVESKSSFISGIGKKEEDLISIIEVDNLTEEKTA